MGTVLTQWILNDGLAVYRVSVLSAGDLRILFFPMLLWLANIVMAVRVIQLQATTPNQDIITSAGLRPWLLAFWVITVILNTLTTGAQSCSSTMG
jgi:hypothetical protein